MEPRIQYAKTGDGVSIAFWTLGEGPVLVHAPLLFSHIQREWQIPECRSWYERLAEKRQLVRYDYGGTGLSDRDVADFSVDAFVRQLEAVVDQLGVTTFVLCGFMHSGPAAILYAARHPERVSHLILWCSYARASDWVASPDSQSVRTLMDKDWKLYTEVVAHEIMGWSEVSAPQYAALSRESISQETFLRAIPALNQSDVTPFLAQVRAPTLVLYRRHFLFDLLGAAKHLASGIPGAQLAVLDGESGAPYLEDMDSVLAVLDNFLDEGARDVVGAARGLLTILFTDITDSTALTQRLGDANAQELVRAHNAIVREALRSQSGTEIKHTGDGIMASFPSASGALECAVAIQRGILEWGDRAHGHVPLQVHIGLNAGEPVADEGDLFGTAVQLARRICDQASGGEILASDVVRQLAAGKGFLFADRGEVVPKGFDEAVRLYEVRWRAEGSPQETGA